MKTKIKLKEQHRLPYIPGIYMGLMVFQPLIGVCVVLQK